MRVALRFWDSVSGVRNGSREAESEMGVGKWSQKWESVPLLELGVGEDSTQRNYFS